MWFMQLEIWLALYYNNFRPQMAQTLQPQQSNLSQESSAVPQQGCLGKNQEKGESQFRVHFYLCGLQVPRTDTVEQFLEHVRDRVAKIGTPQFVQVYEQRQDRVDVLVGMKYDFQAINYLHCNIKKILVRDQMGAFRQVAPVVGQLFEQHLVVSGKPSIYPSLKTYKQRLQLKGEQRGAEKIDERNAVGGSAVSQQQYSTAKPTKEPSSTRKQSSRQPDPSRQRSRRRRERSQSGSRARRSRPRSNSCQPARVAVLGIPLEYDYRDVDQELERWGVCFNKLIWRTEDNMEYLEINLKSIRDLRNLDSFRRIRSYPVMVLKNPRSTSLLSMLRDYQVKVDVRGKIQTNDLIEFFKEFGPIVLLLHEDQNMQSFYIVYRDRTSALDLLRTSKNRDIIDCYPPKNPIEVKRLRKAQTFTYNYSGSKPSYHQGGRGRRYDY